MTTPPPAPTTPTATEDASRMRVGVVGLGYLGAVHAACMAVLGHEVIGIDVDERTISALESGRAPFHEPGLPELLASTLGQSLSVTRDATQLKGCDVVFICVGTPQLKGDLAADTSHVFAAFDSVADLLTGPALVVGKSTVPVGTAEAIEGRLAHRNPELEVAWNPEFLREGTAIENVLHPARLVFGVRSPEAEAILRRVYAGPITDGAAVLVADFPTAELVKSATNAFLATKISFINAMAEVCEATGADVSVLADAIGQDDRIGRHSLSPGVGFGGGCLPKDVRAFKARAEDLGVSQAVAFLSSVDEINLRRRDRVLELARTACGGSFTGKRVAVLGAAFKPSSDDVRDSPSLNVAARAQYLGASVTVADPAATESARRVWPSLEYTTNVLEALNGADVVLLLTEWSDYTNLDPAVTKAVVRQPVIIDGRNVLDARAWHASGWTYHGLGRPSLIAK